MTDPARISAVVAAWQRVKRASSARTPEAGLERARASGELTVALNRLEGVPTEVVVDGEMGREPSVMLIP
jgi:hypothetical protein